MHAIRLITAAAVAFGFPPAAAAQDGAEAGDEVIEVWADAPLEVDAPGETDVDRDELQTAAGSRGGDAIAALRSLPGIANVSASNGIGDLVIRGTGSEDSIYLLDGVEMPLIMHFGDALTVVPTEMLDAVEFAPGGFDVQFGRATGGVVHLVTRATPVVEATGFAELSFINAAGYVQTPLSRDHGLSLAASFRRSLIDLVVPAMVPDDVDLSFNVPPRYYDGQLKIDWLPNPRHSVSVLAFMTEDRMELDLDEENAQDRALTGVIGGEDGLWRVLARWQYDAGPVRSTTVASYGRVLRTQHVGDDFFYRLEPEIGTVRNDLRLEATRAMTLRAGAEAQIERGRQSGATPLPGSEGMNGDVFFDRDPMVEFDEAIDDDVYAAYLAADLRPVPALSLTPGVRVDHYGHIDDTTLSPRFAAAYKLGDTTARFAVGLYSRPLALAEALPRDLEAERAMHYVVGVDRVIREGVKLAVTGYYTALRDLIVRDLTIDTGDPFDQYVNRGTGAAYGGEAVLRVRRGALRGWLSYTLSRSTRRDAPGADERLFDQDQTHNMVAAATYARGPWSVSGRFRLASGTPYSPIEGAVYMADGDHYEPTYGAHNSERFELAHQLDVRVDRWFDLGGWRLSAFLDVSNVYANARTIGYEYNFDYTERESVTDIPLLPAIGLRGAF